MNKHYNVHFSKGALPPRSPTEHCFLGQEPGHQKGCCHQRCRDPSAPRTHRPRRLPPQAYWPLAYLGPLGGSSWGPQPPVHQQQWQPQSPPPGPLRQRLCPVHQAQKGRPAASVAPRGSASAPQSPPASTSAPAMATATATANSSSPVQPSATATVLEPGPPTDARPLPAPAACGPFTSSTEILTEDDVYCSCLAKTLCHVPVPVTVGFYAPFGCRLHLMLDKITALMQQEAAQREAEELQRVQWRPRAVSGWGLPRLLWYLVFLQPVITEAHLRRKNVQFLFIRFSAWQYAGTDKLWAGLVTTLCEGIRRRYGALPFSVYSVLGNKPAARGGFCRREWHCRRRVCLGLVALLAALGLGVALLYLSVGGGVAHAAAAGGAGADGAAAAAGAGAGSHVMRALGGAATTLSGSGLLMAVYSVGKHLFVSQRRKIERLVSREKFGSQLGFMCEVKKEVELLTDFLCFLEIFQRRRLRVVLEVTGLDTCYPERVVGVLNAINTLLSDSHAPFVFLLVVDPSILAACLENAGSMKGTADNGYLFLNRTVTLPFSVPVMGRRTKLRFLHDAVQSRDDLLYREMTRQLRPAQAQQQQQQQQEAAGLPGASAEGAQLLAVVHTDAEAVEAEATRRIQQALLCLHDERDCLYEYVPDNVVSMRRIVNTVPITVRLLQEQQRLQLDVLGPTPRQAVAWVVLANQWPCRLSWVLQCLEDRQQQQERRYHHEHHQNQEQPPKARAAEPAPEPRARLWDVFCHHSPELHSLTATLQKVLDLDGDPELFERFLRADFPFTVGEAQSLLRCTVNLDHSIRRRMGLLRAVSTLKPPSPPKSPQPADPHPRTPGGGSGGGTPRASRAGPASPGRSPGHSPQQARQGQAPPSWTLGDQTRLLA
ncbi:NTPase KAP family P-loop domain-containing protein 1 [Suncus etruscus]|uniref:NTPase KAP family P-loop domain-containing protein 1 n=1 Tax=Suncus etruscus TaxID=109475 RepID=UPI002110AB17|nr:NTPase KAP family P-loop domain-containing protein 1 [Suncus etruscus]